MPTIDVLMHGSGLSTDVGVVGFCAVLLIEEGDRRILFDSAHVGRRTYLLAQLEARGLTPDDIDAQVLSHAHWDHVQNADLFPNAPLLAHPSEVAYAHDPHINDWATPGWTGAILDLMRIEEVGEGSELMPGCRVIELPGHSPGSIGLEVETEDGVCIIAGDAIHNAAVAVSGHNPLVFWNAEQADASVRRVAESEALVYPGHDLPFRLRDGQPDYVGEERMTLVNVGAERPGQSFVPFPPPREQWIMPGIEEQRLGE
jgi:N-acyl homoserine lactone hydrolase